MLKTSLFNIFGNRVKNHKLNVFQKNIIIKKIAMRHESTNIAKTFNLFENTVKNIVKIYSFNFNNDFKFRSKKF